MNFLPAVTDDSIKDKITNDDPIFETTWRRTSLTPKDVVLEYCSDSARPYKNKNSALSEMYTTRVAFN